MVLDQDKSRCRQLCGSYIEIKHNKVSKNRTKTYQITYNLKWYICIKVHLIIQVYFTRLLAGKEKWFFMFLVGYIEDFYAVVWKNRCRWWGGKVRVYYGIVDVTNPSGFSISRFLGWWLRNMIENQWLLRPKKWRKWRSGKGRTRRPSTRSIWKNIKKDLRLRYITNYRKFAVLQEA